MQKYYHYLKDKQRFAIPDFDFLNDPENVYTISQQEYLALIEGVKNGNRIEYLDGGLVLVKNEIPDNSAIEYKTLRSQEYPPITDYIDGIVKGDQQQIQDYIDKCLAVKLKYPKPE